MTDCSEPYRLIPNLRRRTRFSLRTLLATFTLLPLWFGFFFNRVQNERRAAEVIAAASGTIAYDWQIRPSGSDLNVELQRPGPEWLRRYLGPHWFDQIVEVRLNQFVNPSESNDSKLVIRHLTKLPALRALTLWGRTLDLEDCELLGRLTQVEELSLRPDSVIELQHAAAIARARNLKEFRLSSAKISAPAICELAAIPNLCEIQITCDSYDSQTGKPLAEYYLDDEAAISIATLPNLRSVMLFNTRITDDGVEALCELANLKTLVVSSPHVSSAVFKHVAKLRHLEHLGTWAWRINDADFRQLSQMPNLVSLGLQTNLTDESVPHLLLFEGLEKLTLRGDEVTEDSVQYLCTMRKLTWLDLSNTSIAKNSEAAALLKRSLPGCRISLPKTEREKEIKRQFNNWKWGGPQP